MRQEEASLRRVEALDTRQKPFELKGLSLFRWNYLEYFTKGMLLIETYLIREVPNRIIFILNFAEMCLSIFLQFINVLSSHEDQAHQIRGVISIIKLS